MKMAKGAERHQPVCRLSAVWVREAAGEGVVEHTEASGLEILPHYSQSDFLLGPHLAVDHLYGSMWMQ